MSIEDIKTIDFITVTPDKDYVLTISDHLSWDNEDHLFILQEKLNTYISFIESNEIYGLYPKAKGCKIFINLVCRYPIIGTVELSFLKEVEIVLKNININFQWEYSRMDS